MPALQETLEDPEKTSLAAAARILWFTLCACIVATCIYDGTGFTYGGDRLAAGPAFQQLRDWPGMRSHGVILLALAAAVIYTVGRRTPFWPLVGLTFYSALVTFQIFAAWATTGVIVWSAPSKWLFLVLPGSLVLALTFSLSRGAVLAPRRRRVVPPEPPRGCEGAA